MRLRHVSYMDMARTAQSCSNARNSHTPKNQYCNHQRRKLLLEADQHVKTTQPQAALTRPFSHEISVWCNPN